MPWSADFSVVAEPASVPPNARLSLTVLRHTNCGVATLRQMFAGHRHRTVPQRNRV